MTAAVLQWDEISEGMEISFPVCASAADMDSFATISGDFNPLHCDEAFAASKGFGGRVVYGALLTAYVSRAIGMHLPGRDCIFASLDIKFKNPLLMNEEATLTATVKQKSDSVKLLDIGIRITTASKKIAIGTAQVIVRQ